MSGSLLVVAHETIGHVVVVHVAGEIDLVTAPELEENLEKACARARPPEVIVADLSEVTFLGSAAMGVLLDIDRRCRSQATPLRVVATTAATMHPLRVTGLDQILGVVSSLASVIRSA